MKILEQIRIKPCSYKGFEFLTGNPEILDFYPTHLRYILSASGKKKDKDLGIDKEFDYDADCLIMKDKITGMDFGWSNTKEAYEMEIHPTGLVLVFSSKEEGETVKNKLYNWLTS